MSEYDDLDDPAFMARKMGVIPHERDTSARTCKHCGGSIDERNPTGNCDHLYWPDLLTDEAKRANGFRPVQKTVWEK